MLTKLLPSATTARQSQHSLPTSAVPPCAAQFFFQIEQEQQSFALYTEATKFIRHRDGMVRSCLQPHRHSIFVEVIWLTACLYNYWV